MEQILALPLEVTCPLCGRTAILNVKRMRADKFTVELCDGVYGARHPAVTMTGPKGLPNA